MVVDVTVVDAPEICPVVEVGCVFLVWQLLQRSPPSEVPEGRLGLLSFSEAGATEVGVVAGTGRELPSGLVLSVASSSVSRLVSCE